MAKYTGKGGELQIRTVVSPETWLTVAQIKEIGSISITAEEIDVTTLDDNESGLSTDYKDTQQGFKDPGEMPVTVLFDPNLLSHVEDPNSLYESFDQGITQLVRIKYPVSPVKYLRANGYFRDWQTPALNATDPVESTFVFRLRQKPVLSTT